MNPNFVQEGMARSPQPITFQRCSIGLRFSAGEKSSSRPNSLIHVFMVLTSCTGAQSCWNRKGPSTNCSYKGGSMNLSKVPHYAEASRVPFNGTEGPSPNSEKDPHTITPPPKSLHLAQCRQTTTVLLATAKRRLFPPVARQRSAIRYVFTAIESSGSTLYTTAPDQVQAESQMPMSKGYGCWGAPLLPRFITIKENQIA